MTRKDILIFALLLVTLVACGIYAFVSARDEKAEVQHEDLDVESQERKSGSRGAKRQSVSEAASLPDPDQVLETDTKSEKIAAHEVHLLVVDASTKAPCAGMKVRVELRDVLRKKLPRPGPATNTLLPDDFFGRVLMTDDRGRISWPSNAKSTWVIQALDPRKFGSRTHRASKATTLAEPLRLEVARYHLVTIGVNQRDGRPAAGVDVGIGVRGRTYDFLDRPITTDDSGRASYAVFPHLLRKYRNSDPTIAFGFEAQGIFRQAVSVPLQIEAELPPAVSLTLPLCGSVRLRALNSDGVPFAPKHQVELGISGTRRGVQRRKIRDGVLGAVFSPVEVGVELEATINASWEDLFRTTKAVVLAPHEKESQAPADIQVKTDVVVIRGRVVSESGQILASRPLMVSEIVTGSSSGYATEVDAHGYFQVRLHKASTSTVPRERPQGYRVEIATPPGAIEVDSAPPVFLELKLPPTFSFGLNDLGDLYLNPVPLIASGKVRNQDGEAINGVPLELSFVSISNQRLSRRSWHHHSDAEGRFRIWARLLEDRQRSIRIKVGGTDHVASPLTFEPEAHNLVIETKPARSLQVKVQLPPEIEPAMIRLSVVSADSKETTGSMRHVIGKPEYRVESIDCERVRIRIMTREGLTIQETEPISLPLGESLRVPPIHLSSSVSRYEVVFEGLADEHSMRRSVSIRAKGSQRSSVHLERNRKRLTFIHPQPSVTLEYWADSFRPQLRKLQPGRNVIQIENGNH